MNPSDYAKLTSVIKKLLGAMMKVQMEQVVVYAKELHAAANLGNTRVGALRAAVDDILSQKELIRGGYGRFIVSDIEDDNGQAQLIIARDRAKQLARFQSDGGFALNSR